MNSLNKKLALVLWGKDKNGEDEKNLEILEEWLPRVTKIPEDLKEMLMDCEYQLALSIGDVDETSESYESFGLKWPSN